MKKAGAILKAREGEVLSFLTFRVQPHVPARLAAEPWGVVFPMLPLAELFGMRRFAARRDELKSFLASCAFILGMLTSAVLGLYPFVLPANTDPALGLRLYNAKAPDDGLRVGLVWWIVGMILVSGYFVFVYRHCSGKVRLEGEGRY